MNDEYLQTVVTEVVIEAREQEGFD